MSRKQVIAKLKELNLPMDSYVAYGSSPMAIAEIREVNDVDILAKQEIYDNLKAQGWEVINKGINDAPVSRGVFEVHASWAFSSYNPSLEELKSRATVVQGISFASLHDVLEWKRASVEKGFNPEKNLADIALIERYFIRETELRKIDKR